VKSAAAFFARARPVASYVRTFPDRTENPGASSEDPALIDASKRTWTYIQPSLLQVFGVALEEVTREQRNRAKNDKLPALSTV